MHIHAATQPFARAMLGSVALLAIIGLLAGTSAAPPGEALSVLGLRALHLALAVGAFLLCWLLPEDRLRAVSSPALVALFVVLCAMLLLRGFGHESHAATRWVQIGPMRLQPSVFLQFFWPVWLSSWIARDPLRLSDRRELLRLLATFTVLSIPVLFQPDLGSCLILLAVTWLTLMFAGAVMRKVLGWGLILFAGIGLAGLLFFRHVLGRLLWFREPGGQLLRASEALRAGGLTGLGPGQGVIKHGYLPEGETDFIFALIGEEWGLLGTGAIWLLFMLFTVAGIALARRAGRRYGAVLVASATLMISIQAALNMAVVTGAVPPKGLPLPFVSRGGSSALALAALLGTALRAASTPPRSNASKPNSILWKESTASASSHS